MIRTALELTPTDRGFLRGEFQDSRRSLCFIQESSIATEPMLWLGQEQHGMRLTQEQAAILLPHLVRFVETGELG